MKKIRPTFQYCLILGVFWASYAAIFAYASVYLLAHDFTNSQIGYLIAGAGVISAVLQPMFGGFADKAAKCILHKLIVALSLIMILAAGLLLGLGRGFWVIALLYGVLMIFLQVITPLNNSLGMFYKNKGVPVNFGIARGIGSISYAGLSALLGVLTEKVSVDTVMYSVVIIYVLLIVLILTFHFKGTDEGNVVKGEAVKQKSMADFAKENKGFMAVLIGEVFLFVSHNAIGNYLYQIVVYRGYTSTEMGYATSIMAAVELPTLFLLSLIIKKIKSGALIKISGIFMFVKAFCLIFAATAPTIYATMCFQMLGYGLYAGASVYYVNHTVDEANQVRGQSLVTMVMTVGSVIGSLVAGILLDKTSVPVLLWFSGIVAFIGAVIVIAFAQKGKNE